MVLVFVEAPVLPVLALRVVFPSTVDGGVVNGTVDKFGVDFVIGVVVLFLYFAKLIVVISVALSVIIVDNNEVGFVFLVVVGGIFVVITVVVGG